MNQTELNKILELHKKWLKNDSCGVKADLCNSDLRHSNLRFADLRFADLRNSDLRNADLSNADLCNTNLCNTNLCDAKLSGAKLDGVIYDENTAFFALQCPEEGSFVGWKKCLDDTIVKLLIPEDAKRSSATTRKCRCDKARVLEIWDENGEPIQEARSSYSPSFVYRIGETVCVPDFDEDRWHECAPGIHFFITRREAELYD